VEGKLYVLPNAYELDGRVATHPLDARGFAPLNSYLVVEQSHALLIDTGWSVHEQSLLAQLDSLIDRSTPLTLWLLRSGEFAGICNTRPIVETFSVGSIYGAGGDPPAWADFRPEFVPYGAPVGGGAMSGVERCGVAVGEPVRVGDGRALLPLDAPLRLLSASWIYDAETRTLFTADAFTYAWQPTEHGPWLVTSDNDPTTPEGIWDYLVHSRFWWLAGARTEPLRTAIAAIFDSYDIETIAPAFGCVLHGRDLVDRHRRALDTILAHAATAPSIGREVAQWRIRSEA
jgi:hypothetical protein